jgi:hypothetical protein
MGWPIDGPADHGHLIPLKNKEGVSKERDTLFKIWLGRQDYIRSLPRISMILMGGGFANLCVALAGQFSNQFVADLRRLANLAI